MISKDCRLLSDVSHCHRQVQSNQCIKVESDFSVDHWDNCSWINWQVLIPSPKSSTYTMTDVEHVGGILALGDVGILLANVSVQIDTVLIH